MSELPPGWSKTTIGTLTEYMQRGKSPKYAEQSELPVINQKCIRWNELQLQHLKYIHPDQFDRWDKSRFIRPGDILWNSTGTGTVGRAYQVKSSDCVPPKVVDSHVTIVRHSPEIDARYLFNWIKSPAVQSKIEEMCDGTTNQIELSRVTIATTEIPLAPRREQTRITDQLDTLLTRIQACNDRFDAIPALLKRFRQTVWEAALNGGFLESLAISLRETSTVQISSIATVGTGSTPLRSNAQFFASIGTPWVTSSATSQAVINEAHEFVTAEAILAHRLKLFPKGTLLVAMYGEGKTRGQVAELGIEATINQACAAVVVDTKKALVAYVKIALQANYLNMRELAEGGNQPNLNLSKVKEFEIPLPSLEMQTTIVRRVNELFSIADKFEASCTIACNRAERLIPLLLAKAFRGELVPQDPTDEPASALLARLSTKQSNAEIPAKSRQPSKHRTSAATKEQTTMSKSRQDEDVKGKPYLAKHLHRMGKGSTAGALFKEAELPVADFYKQLAWEVDQGLINESQDLLEPNDAA
jgi:type I restriction enzyme, S subunit